jgi:hypothetical protein
MNCAMPIFHVVLNSWLYFIKFYEVFSFYLRSDNFRRCCTTPLLRCCSKRLTCYISEPRAAIRTKYWV